MTFQILLDDSHLNAVIDQVVFVYQFNRVVQLANQKAWRVGDLFSAVAQFCQLQQELEQRGRTVPSLFDWILKTKR